MLKKTLGFAIATLLLAGIAASAQDGAELMQKSLDAYHYPGEDGKAEISMEIVDKSGGIRNREMVMLRKNTGDKGGNQRFFIYFKQPGDVREMTFMVYKNVGGSDERWLFVPSVKLVRKIAADDKRSSFVGSDFVYEDVSGRSVDQSSHEFVREEELNGRASYVVKSTPKDKVEFAYKLTWIDKEHHLPMKEEYYGEGDALLRTFTIDGVENIGDIPTAMVRTMKDHNSGGHTVIKVSEAEYDIGIKENDFSERRMRRPPRNWIR